MCIPILRKLFFVSMAIVFFTVIPWFQAMGFASEKIVMNLTGEDLSDEVARFNGSQKDYELIVNNEAFINWRQAANRFRYKQGRARNGDSGQKVDVAFVDNNWLPGLIRDGSLKDLTNGISNKDRFLPGLLDIATDRGKLYAVPFSTKGLVLYYRKDFHETYGLKKPENMVELAANCRVLIEKEKLSHGLTLHYSAMHLDVLPLLWSQGGDILKNGKAALHESENIDVLNYLQGLAKEGILPGKEDFEFLKKAYRNALATFMEGRSAYLISWSNRLTDLENSPLKDRFGVMHIPAFKPGQPDYSVTGSWYLAINASSSMDKGALAFLEAICSDSYQYAMAEKKPGFLPVISSYYNRDDGHPAVHPMFMDTMEALKHMRHRLNDPRESEIDFIFENAVRQILVEGKDAKSVLSMADQRIDMILAEE